ncbi:MAG TPA: GntR family transcriptional regulator [Bryobacteraceae bacterium]|jgi:DNA-binding GntR family transcriptional regulator|nr:GntR family transcriptional regulator [Bryobacteraceae bacterium]
MAHRLRAHARDSSATASLSQKAYLQLRDKILRGEFPLGAALSRRGLAIELHMSFLPISEALQRLEREGLVESKPRVGTRVRIPSAQDIEDRYIMREALETQAARLFAEKASPEQKEELCRMGKHLDHLYDACGSISADTDFLYSVHTYHMNLHMRIAESARCQTLCDAIESQQVLIFNWLYDTAAQQRSLPPNFHAALTAALASGDPNKADAEMRRHIRYGLDQIQNQIGSLQSNGDGWRLKRAGRGD